jgi:putative membrane protein insertion efficiency factor
VKLVSALLIGLVRLYQMVLRPIMPPACRFFPSCSDYALEAVRAHGPARGAVLAVRRLCKCHPFHEGGFDPVPPAVPRGAHDHVL